MREINQNVSSTLTSLCMNLMQNSPICSKSLKTNKFCSILRIHISNPVELLAGVIGFVCLPAISEGEFCAIYCHVTLDKVLDWMLDLLLTYIPMQAITPPLLISTIHKSPQHPLGPVQPVVFSPAFPGSGF
jgi:hypothetical protein